MPKFTPDLTAVSAGVPVLTAGDYEFSIGEVKTFTNTKTKDDGSSSTTYGVRFSLKVETEGEYHNRNIPHSIYLHNPEGLPFAKQFVLAAYGFANNFAGEQEFNAQYADNEDAWSIDPDPEVNYVGDVWKGLAGRRISASVKTAASKAPNAAPGTMQNQFAWFPFG